MGNGERMCENEQGWRWIAVCIALRDHLPDEAARAKAAEDVAALWRAFDDGDEAVARFLDAHREPVATTYAGRDVDDRAAQRDDPEWRMRA